MPPLDGVRVVLLGPEGLDGDIAQYLGAAGAALAIAFLADTALDLCLEQQHLLDAVVIDLRPDGRDEGLKALLAPPTPEKPSTPIPVVIVSDRITEPEIDPSRIASWVMAPIDVETLLFGVEHAAVAARRMRARRS